MTIGRQFGDMRAHGAAIRAQGQRCRPGIRVLITMS